MSVIIRAAQLDIFANHAAGRHRDRLAATFAAATPLSATDLEARQAIDRTIASGLACGNERAADNALYVASTLLSSRSPELHVFKEEIARRFDKRPICETVLPCNAGLARIAIVLVDLLDRPVRGERYQITLPDGAMVEGVLDDKGMALVEQLDPGKCIVRFPDLDASAVEVSAS